MKKPAKTKVKSYKGSHSTSSRIFKKDAALMAKTGYYPISQNFHADSWGFGSFLIALVLCFVIIGIFIFIYMLIFRPSGGVLTVTYEYKGKGEEKECPECAEMIKESAKICRFCRYEFNRDDDNPEGLKTRWYESGQKKQESNYKNNKREGLDTLWYEDGQKMREANYKDGNQEDYILYSWHKNGQKKQESNYKNDNQEGLTTWWYESGQKKTKGNYKGGKLDGLVTMWDKNGQKVSESHYKDGEVV